MRWLLIAPLTLVLGCVRPVARCDDGVRNGEESDVDCGGSVCQPCAVRLLCLTATDCASGICRGNVCSQPTPDCMGTECPQQVQCRHNSECANGFCLNGSCFIERCDAPLVKCGSQCVDPRFDHLNCGGCGIPCQPGQACSSGLCMDSCEPPLLACGAGPNVRCIDVSVDVMHCGDCTTVCAPGETCRFGSCQLECPFPRQACNGECVLTNSDVQHCGRCNSPCDAGTVCVQGLCAPTCGAPLMTCTTGAPCVDARFDPLNCGGCGMACPAVPNARPLCLDMNCGRSRCNPGFEDCDGMPGNGCEANFSNDPMNCGTCGRQCFGGPCVNGNCP